MPDISYAGFEPKALDMTVVAAADRATWAIYFILYKYFIFETRIHKIIMHFILSKRKSTTTKNITYKTVSF